MGDHQYPYEQYIQNYALGRDAYGSSGYEGNYDQNNQNQHNYNENYSASSQSNETSYQSLDDERQKNKNPDNSGKRNPNSGSQPPRGGYQQRYNNYNNNANNYSNNNNNNNLSYDSASNNRKSFQDNKPNTSNESNFRGYQNDSKSGNSDVQIQRDTIFIQNLPKTVTNEDLKQNFGSIGVIKIEKKTNLPKIWIYKDKTTGEGKGEATVTYDDEAAASAAIEWFNDKEVLGKIVTVQLAFRKNNFTFNKTPGRGGSSSFRGNKGNSGGGGGNGGNNDRSKNFANRNNFRSGGEKYSRPAPY